MYRILYGSRSLHDPRSEETILDEVSLEQESNSCGYLEFTIYPDHPEYNSMKERDTDNPICVYFDETLLFRGYIYEFGKDFNTVSTVKCKGELDYLTHSLIRPYCTVGDIYPLKAPDKLDRYFDWLISQHNTQVDKNKQFRVGINEGAKITNDKYIYIENKDVPNTLDEILDKIVDNIGGYIRIRYPDGVRTIDLLYDYPDVNTQVFEFGENLMDYEETLDASEIFTAIRPTGKTPDAEEGEDYSKKLPITIDTVPDGEYEEIYVKKGDYIYCPSAVDKYGYIFMEYSDSDIEDPMELLRAGISTLRPYITTVKTIELKGIDLAMIDPKFSLLRVGEYVHIRSKPHNFDSYMQCSKIEPDLTNPENTTYTLGAAYDTLTGIQNKRIKELNASINSKYEKVESLSEEAKQAANAAVISSYDEYSVNDSSTVPPNDGWSKETPKWTPGRYIWRRVVSVYGSGKTVVGEPALMTGNSGIDGQDSIFLQIYSSNGVMFKNSDISTTLAVSIIVGDTTITDNSMLIKEFGERAYLQWEQKLFQQNEFTPIDRSDPRLSDNGFLMTLYPQDVRTQTVFNCVLYF